jgi:cytoskeletal protein CcmA (bactofilin family)
MFSKGNNGRNRDRQPAPEIEMVAAVQPKQQRSARSAPSILSADVVVVGNLTSGGDIQIDGTIEGDVRSVSLTIGDKATINGEIVADDVVVRGRVIGSIHARRVQLCSNCHVEGNILHEALAVETGAYFEGNCRHSADPLGEERGNSGGILGNDKKPGTGRSTGGILGNLGNNRSSLADAAGKEPAEDDGHSS